MSSEESNKLEYSIENDPLYKPINQDKKAKIDKAVEKQIRSLSLDENVDTDSTKVPGQNYALISVVSPQSGQKCDNICLKIKGVFKTLEEANKHAEMLQQIDSVFDIFVVEMYSWLLVPPDPELLEQKHVDHKLNEIVGGHRESQLKAKAYFDERKRELLENINIEKIDEEEETKVEEVVEEVNKSESNNVPIGVNAESSINILPEKRSDGNCPNSGPDTENGVTPTELMEGMLNSTLNQNLKEID